MGIVATKLLSDFFCFYSGKGLWKQSAKPTSEKKMLTQFTIVIGRVYLCLKNVQGISKKKKTSLTFWGIIKSFNKRVFFSLVPKKSVTNTKKLKLSFNDH